MTSKDDILDDMDDVDDIMSSMDDILDDKRWLFHTMELCRTVYSKSVS